VQTASLFAQAAIIVSITSGDVTLVHLDGLTLLLAVAVTPPPSPTNAEERAVLGDETPPNAVLGEESPPSVEAGTERVPN
jgi:hypothetical protein